MGIYLTGVKLKEIEEDFRLADYLSDNIGNEGLEDFLNQGNGYGEVSYNGHLFSKFRRLYLYVYRKK